MGVMTEQAARYQAAAVAVGEVIAKESQAGGLLYAIELEGTEQPVRIFTVETFDQVLLPSPAAPGKVGNALNRLTRYLSEPDARGIDGQPINPDKFVIPLTREQKEKLGLDPDSQTSHNGYRLDTFPELVAIMNASPVIPNLGPGARGLIKSGLELLEARGERLG